MRRSSRCERGADRARELADAHDKLSFEAKQELQQRLSTLGYYDGKVDGRIGEGSKKAIRAFQAQAGLSQDGYPSMEVLSSLRKH